MRRRRTVTVIALVVAASAIAGCVTTREPADKPAARGVTVKTDTSAPQAEAAGVGGDRAAPGTPSTPSTPSAPAQPGGPDPLASIEPCAARLQDVAGVMLLYYALNQRLPDGLEELRGVADIDQALEFTCPASGRPYVYDPAGLRYPGKDERLIIYDADPAHDGRTRWGVLAAPPKGKRPAAMWAVPLTDEVFNTYLKSASE